MGNKGLDYTALVITVIGAINWGLIGLFRLDLVALIFGQMSWISRIIYVIVGKYEEASGRMRVYFPEDSFLFSEGVQPYFSWNIFRNSL